MKNRLGDKVTDKNFITDEWTSKVLYLIQPPLRVLCEICGY